MSAVDYYHHTFPRDINKVMASSPYGGRRLSLVCLVTQTSVHQFDRCHRVFMALDEKVQFCFCLFFTTLIDQAIHAGLREEHSVFDLHAQYPKMVGILSGAHSNVHPALLLGIATLYLDDRCADDDLEELSQFFRQDYRHFLKDVLPTLPGRQSGPYNPNHAVKQVFSTIQSALASAPGLSGFPFRVASKPPDRNRYQKWVDVTLTALS